MFHFLFRVALVSSFSTPLFTPLLYHMNPLTFRELLKLNTRVNSFSLIQSEIMWEGSLKEGLSTSDWSVGVSGRDYLECPNCCQNPAREWLASFPDFWCQLA